jgi:hypothetical protein
VIINPYAFGGSSPPPTDPLYASVLSLLHCEGTNGAQVFNDEKGLAWVADGGNTFTVTAQKAFGSSSILVETIVGTGSHGGISTPDTSGFHTGTGEFSLEWLQYWNSFTDFQNIYSYGGTASGGLLVETGSSDGKYIIYLSGSVIATESSAPSLGGWYQYSMVRDASGVFKIARAPLGSTPVVTATSSAQVASIGITGASPTWGAYVSGQNATSSYIDELRITAAARAQNVIQTAPWPNA